MPIDTKAYRSEQSRITENQLEEMVLRPYLYEHLAERYRINASNLMHGWKRGAKLLDVGCRTGAQLAFLLKAVTKDLTLLFQPEDLYGIDVCEKAVRICERSQQGFNVCLADMHDMPFKDGFFGIVIANQVLEHAHDPERVVGEMWRVLAPGGVAIADVPCQRGDSYADAENDAGHLQFFEFPFKFYDLFKGRFDILDKYFETGRWPAVKQLCILRTYGGVFRKR